jgi:glycosyltransferase involved in cell wall biosynthesis
VKYLYFWCDIVTPHWLGTLRELSQVLNLKVKIYAGTLEQPSDRKIFDWGSLPADDVLEFNLKQTVNIDRISDWPSGYHLICNPFNNPFNRNLIREFHRCNIEYGLQQSRPGLIATMVGKLLRRVGYRIFFKSTIDRASYVLCHGEMCRNFLKDTVGNPQKLFVSGYFVPATGRPDLLERPEGRPIRAVYLGQFVHRKRVLQLARGLRKAMVRAEFEFDFAGAGEQRDELEEIWAGARGRVLPPAKHADVVGFLSRYDVLVLPSSADEWGVVVNEAIHSGCGVIVTDSCGSSDLVRHSGCGEVVGGVGGCVRALLGAVRKPSRLRRWQTAARALSPLIEPREGALYLAKIISGGQHAEGPGACCAPWILDWNELRRLKVAVIYHFFAHYRLPILRELMDSKQMRVVCYGSYTSEGVDGSIKPLTLRQLPALKVTPLKIVGNFIWQRSLVFPLIAENSDIYIFLASPYFVSTWVAVIILRLMGKRVLFWGHLRYREDEGVLRHYIRQSFYKLASGWLCYGHAAKQQLVRNGIPRDEVHVVYNSLDYDRHLGLRGATSCPVYCSWPRKFEAMPTFICVSRLVTKRRLDLLFEVMRDVATIGCSIQLLLVGDGPERAALEALASKLKIHVIFYGACYDEAVLRTLYTGAVATVAPGEVGLTAIQSLSFGVPVITHNDQANQMPEAEAVVDNVTGWLFEKDHKYGLGRAIARALAADRESMRLTCYRMVDLFFNPRKQVEVIQRSSLGLPAQERDWIQFSKEFVR